MRRSKRKLNIVKLVIFILIMFLIVFLCLYFFLSKRDERLVMDNLVDMEINTVIDNLAKYNLDIDISYEYSSTVLKDRVISQSIAPFCEFNEKDILYLVVSLGEIDYDKLSSDKINELGEVPIMMYHGIKNMKNSDTDYIGGNVDKDGYTRTSEAFYNDLEFYYQKGYRMIKLSDYIDGVIDVPYGFSPIILTFDDGNANNIKVTGIDDDGNIIIDQNSAVGILETFKKKYPDYNVTATFFLTNNLFNQPEYDEKILNWLVDHGYEIGNHTMGHNNFTKIDASKTEEVVGYMYNKLDSIIIDKYSKIVALPFGSPYTKEHENYSHIITSTYNGVTYQTKGVLRVGWEPEESPFNKNFDATFLKRCRAYDNNGMDFDIEMVFNSILNKTRYISDGNVDSITTSSMNESLINKDIDKEIILY